MTKDMFSCVQYQQLPLPSVAKMLTVCDVSSGISTVNSVLATSRVCWAMTPPLAMIHKSLAGLLSVSFQEGGPAGASSTSVILLMRRRLPVGTMVTGVPSVMGVVRRSESLLTGTVSPSARISQPSGTPAR